MKPGRQWFVFDADFFDNTFTRALLERFGPAGITLFVAFLCACKRSHIQGRISYRNEWEALEKFGIEHVALADKNGQPFTLAEFWTFTGTYKQTRRTRQGHSIHIQSTAWEDWQQSKNRLVAAERKRRSRAENSHKTIGLDIDSENDSERDSENVTQTSSKNPRPTHPTATPVPDWTGDPEPDEPLIDIRSALAQLRRRQDVDG